MQTKRTLLSKISPPRVSRVFLRKRLMRLLDQSRKKSAIWVCGPAGSGKTTLVASYLKERKLPCIWYQVDKRDEDVASLFYYMGLAVKKAFPRIKKPLPVLSSEYISGLDAFTQYFFKSLYARLRKPFILVFDN